MKDGKRRAPAPLENREGVRDNKIDLNRTFKHFTSLGDFVEAMVEHLEKGEDLFQ
jgi:hypothetical protein